MNRRRSGDSSGSVVARFEQSVRTDLQGRRWLRVHALLLATVCFSVAWATSAGLMHAGVDSLALRWPLALAAAYLAFLGLLWLWCRWLLSGRTGGDPQLDLGGGGAEPDLASLPWRAGGGGDFGGAGAQGSGDSGAASEAAGSGGGSLLEGLDSADEGAVVVVSIAVVVGAAVLIAAALGVVVVGFFGTEVLLGVAVEIAIASAGGALAYRAGREGWLRHAFAHTWRPLTTLVLLVVASGAAIDHWVPQARSLPHAARLLRG